MPQPHPVAQPQEQRKVAQSQWRMGGPLGTTEEGQGQQQRAGASRAARQSRGRVAMEQGSLDTPLQVPGPWQRGAQQLQAGAAGSLEPRAVGGSGEGRCWPHQQRKEETGVSRPLSPEAGGPLAGRLQTRSASPGRRAWALDNPEAARRARVECPRHQP